MCLLFATHQTHIAAARPTTPTHILQFSIASALNILACLAQLCCVVCLLLYVPWHPT